MHPITTNGRGRAAYVTMLLMITALAIFGIVRLSAWHGLMSAWNNPGFVRAIRTAAVMALGLTGVTLVCSAIVGVALAQNRHGSRAAAESPALPLTLFAGVALLLPLYLGLLSLGLIHTGSGMLLLFIVTVLPLSIWQFKTAAAALPAEVAEAARIDGCSGLQLFRYVLLPAIAPAITLVTIFAAMAAWCAAVAAFVPAQSAEFPAAILLVAAPLLILFLVIGTFVGPKAMSRDRGANGA